MLNKNVSYKASAILPIKRILFPHLQYIKLIFLHREMNKKRLFQFGIRLLRLKIPKFKKVIKIYQLDKKLSLYLL